MTRGLRVEIAVICVVFILFCVGGMIWDFTSRLLVSGVDGIMLLFVCLMTAGIFAVMLLVELQRAGILPAFPSSKGKPAATPPASKPAAAAPPAKPAAPAAQPAVPAK